MPFKGQDFDQPAVALCRQLVDSLIDPLASAPIALTWVGLTFGAKAGIKSNADCL